MLAMRIKLCIMWVNLNILASQSTRMTFPIGI